MWVAASENVRVIDNEMHSSVIGLEISVSNDVFVTHNRIHDNTLGVGLFHPNAAGNLPLPVMANWVVEHNNIFANNLPNIAPPGSFQSGLPSGVGVMLLGVSDNVIAKNKIKDNDFVGIGVLGWCTATGGDPAATAAPIRRGRIRPRTTISSTQNWVVGNGTKPPAVMLDFLAADIVYFQFERASGNCFEKNQPPASRTSPPSPPWPHASRPLPTDGRHRDLPHGLPLAQPQRVATSEPGRQRIDVSPVSAAETIETQGCSIVLRRVKGPEARELFFLCQPPAGRRTRARRPRRSIERSSASSKPRGGASRIGRPRDALPAERAGGPRARPRGARVAFSRRATERRIDPPPPRSSSRR